NKNNNNHNNNNRRLSANLRRRPELTREAYTAASSASTRPQSSSSTTEARQPLSQHQQQQQQQPHGSPVLGNNSNDVSQSPRYSVISSTKLQSSKEFTSTEPPKMTKMTSSTSSIYTTPFERKEFLVTLLPCVRFPMMDKEFLLRVVERNADLMAIPLMKDLLIEAYRFHAFNPPAHHATASPALQKHDHQVFRASNDQSTRSSFNDAGFGQKHQTRQRSSTRPASNSGRRSSECYAKREFAPQYAKIILPLNNTDDMTLSRSQRRKR
ncbi:hypothetical protein H4S06_000909, partial [Coemansia sp. BCRC 34490]